MRTRDERRLVQLMKEMIYADGDHLVSIKDKIKRIYARYNLI